MNNYTIAIEYNKRLVIDRNEDEYEEDENEYDKSAITLNFKYNNISVYTFMVDFDELYEKFVTQFVNNPGSNGSNGSNECYNICYINGCVQIHKNHNYLVFETAKCGGNVYGFSKFTVEITKEIDILIEKLKDLKKYQMVSKKSKQNKPYNF